MSFHLIPNSEFIWGKVLGILRLINLVLIVKKSVGHPHPPEQPLPQSEFGVGSRLGRGSPLKKESNSKYFFI